MSLIQTRGLGVQSPRPLFRNLDLTLDAADRIGLVAGNGAGKTTLLRCLAGDAEPGTGQIIRRRGLRVGIVPQDMPPTLLALPLSEAVRRALPATAPGPRSPAAARASVDPRGDRRHHIAARCELRAGL